MHKTLLILILTCSLNNAFTQQQYAGKIFVDTKFKDTFSFSNKWAYPWVTLKDDDGRFSSTVSDQITAFDTTHLYYTANCTTNVQGGYNIRYAQAFRWEHELLLVFMDGMPAYASTFYVHVFYDSFYLEPRTSYPAYNKDEKKSFRFNKQKLILNKSNFKPGELIKGYAEFEFTEVIELPGKPVQERNYFLKGFFRTVMPLQDAYYEGLEEKYFIDEKQNKQRYSDPANPEWKWYNYSTLRLKNDSVFLDQSPVYIYKKDTGWSASDGGFYYYAGTWRQDGATIFFDLTLLYCDYCLVKKNASRQKVWFGRVTDEGILINGRLFRVSPIKPLRSEAALPR